MTNLFKGEQIMFGNKKKIAMIERIDKKLSQIIVILNRKQINAKKENKKDV
jgi:hypothetical protein